MEPLQQQKGLLKDDPYAEQAVNVIGSEAEMWAWRRRGMHSYE
jgi:hypothetical protein